MKRVNRTLLDKIAFWILCVILFDCTALGGGSLIKIFGIDHRMILYGLFFVATIPLIIMNIKELLTNKYLIILVFWAVWLAFCTIKGFKIGNSVSSIISGLIGFASFGILPGMLSLRMDKERIHFLMKVLCVGTAVLALETFAVIVVYNYFNLKIFNDLNLFLIHKEIGGCSYVDNSIVRVFFRSHPLAVCGCASALYLLTKSPCKKEKLFYYGLVTIGFFSLLTSYTRSVYLSLAISISIIFVGLLILKKDGRKQILKIAGKTVAFFMAFLIFCDILFAATFLNHGVKRSIGVDVVAKIESVFNAEVVKPDEESKNEVENVIDEPYEEVDRRSDNLRAETEKELYDRIAENPIFGSGMGASLKVRENLDNANEYFYLDQTMKTGLIGILLYMLPMIFMVITLLFKSKNILADNKALCLLWIAGLIGIAAFSSLNPYLNGSNGIIFYCCTICVFSRLCNKNDTENAEEG